MTRKLPASIKLLHWEELNSTLLLCEDEATLTRWLDEAVNSPLVPVHACLRVHSRLNKVRRTKERAELLARARRKRGQAADV